MTTPPNAPARKRTDAELRLTEIFAAREKLGAAQIAELRAAAFDAFSRTGLPNRNEEAWKYTDLRTLLRDVKPLDAPPDQSTKDAARKTGILNGVEARRIVFVGGFFAPELSDLGDKESGLSVTPLSEALAKDDCPL